MDRRLVELKAEGRRHKGRRHKAEEKIKKPRPSKIPLCVKGRGFLDLKVMFDGKPARYFKVYATYSGFSTDDDFAYATGTNAKGMTRIRLMHHGPWLIKADIKMPAPAELQNKCRQVHYTATLTFEVE